MKKILALLMAAVMLTGAFVLPVGATEHRGLPEGTPRITFDTPASHETAPDGTAMPDYLAPIKFIRTIKKYLYDLTGLPFFETKTFNFTVDDNIQAINDRLYEQSGINFEDAYLNLIQTNQYSELINKIFNIDTVALQAQMNADAARLMEEGHPVQSVIKRFASVWMGVIDSAYARLEPVEGHPELLRMMCEIVYKDGRTDALRSSIYYNVETNTFTSLDGDAALLGYLLDVEEGYLFTGRNIWQRSFGFSPIYDYITYATPYFMQYTTRRIKFNYDDKEWMIQLWKGRYFITNGGEMGIYTRPAGSVGSFYNCAADEDALDMQLDITRGDIDILHMPKQHNWWVSGFAFDDTTYDPASFHYVATVTMKDAAMLKAFTAAVDGISDISYTVNGLDVTLVWG
jgi:hypothetical protein